MDKEQIKKIRFSLDLSQKEFAKKLNVTIHTVQSWEQGVNQPSERAVFKLKGLK
jgi:DNA-binding transcriptional regulator YiaG